jgi:5-formyltetrahydrofolate cyclo-ligase
MPDAAEAKQLLRARMRTVLAGVIPEALVARSCAVCDRIAAWAMYQQARAIQAFVPIPGEIDLRPLIGTALAARKAVCLPRADWAARRIESVPITQLDGLVPAKHGILEPPPTIPALPAEQIDLILVPGVAFDPAGNRLGRGAGFYDRFLADPAVTGLTCGVCLDEQVVPVVPTDPWDVPVKAVASDGRLIVVF